MYYFVDAICSIAEIFFLMFLSGSFFARRENQKWTAILTYSCFGGCLIALSFFPSITLFRTFFWIVFGMIFVIIIFDTRLIAAFFVILSFVAICGLTEVAVMILLSFFDLDNRALMVTGNARILYIIVTHLVELLLVVSVCFVKGYSSGKLTAKVLLPVYPSLVVGILFCCLLASDISNERNMNSFYMIIALGLLYTSITIILYTTKLQEQQDARHNLEIANHHYAMQKEYYEQLHSQQEQTRALWHDIKKYLRAVETESSSNDSLHELQEMVDTIAPLVDVGNRVVNIILSEYIQLANEATTKLILDMQIPSELPMTAADLYILLGNTLDNALDACSSVPQSERMIDLQLRLHNQMLFYRISNPYSQEYIHRKRNQFHGYGLKNVQECVRRNNGNLEISYNDNHFTLTALINLL